MAFIAKDPNKAKYRIDSVTTDQRKMKELCDSKKQVKDYVTGITAEGRTGITVWQRTATPKVVVKKTSTKK